MAKIISSTTYIAPTGDNDFATKKYVDDNAGGGGGSGGPVGSILPWSTNSAPNGYLLCNGAAVSRTTYAELFSVIGTTFGVGDGSTTFNIPDFRGRHPIGRASSGTASVLAETGGSLNHSHSVPAHYHGLGSGADLNITSSGSHTTSIDHDHGSFNTGAQIVRVDGVGVAIPTPSGAFYGTTYSTVAIDVPNFVGNSASTGVHTHPTGNFAGRIGLVTGGVDGNAAMTSGTSNAPYLAINFIIKHTNNVFDATGGITYTQTTYSINADTADASDNKAINISGGGAADFTRGSFISLTGNENAGAGALTLNVGGTSSLSILTNGTTKLNIAQSGFLDSIGSSATPYNNSIARFRASSVATSDAGVIIGSLNGNAPFIIGQKPTTGNLSNFTIAAGTDDGSDNSSLVICGAGAASTTRGGFITLTGNENATPGAILLNSGSSGSIDCLINGISRLNIASTGQLVINSNSSGLAAGVPIIFLRGNSNNERFAIESNNSGVFQFGSFNGTLASRTVTTSSNQIGFIQAGGHDGTNQTYNRAQIIFQAGNSNWTTSSTPTQITFTTTPSGSTGTIARWIINQDGHFIPASSSSFDLGFANTPIRTSNIKKYNSLKNGTESSSNAGYYLFPTLSDATPAAYWRLDSGNANVNMASASGYNLNFNCEGTANNIGFYGNNFGIKALEVAYVAGNQKSRTTALGRIYTNIGSTEHYDGQGHFLAIDGADYGYWRMSNGWGAVEFGSTATRAINILASGGINFSTNGTVRFSVSSTGAGDSTYTSSQIPNIDGNHNLGFDNPRWGNICGHNLKYINLVAYSDRRIKKDIENFELNSLDILDRIRPVSFNWKLEANIAEQYPRSHGFVAQELYDVCPDLVNKGDDKEVLDSNDPECKQWTINQNNLLTTLIDAVKKLKQENDALKLRVQVLEET